MIKTEKSIIEFKGNRAYKYSRVDLLKKEYEVLNILNSLGRGFSANAPDSVVLQQDLSSSCLSYEYINGDIYGQFLKDFGFKAGLFSRKTFKEFIKFQLNLSKLNNLLKVQGTSKRCRLKEFAEKYTYKTALAEINHYKKHNPEILTSDKWSKVFKLLDQNKHIFDDKNLVFGHGDLYPENVIMTKDSFKIIDWEKFSLVPVGFTPAFLYLMFWREKIWQDWSYNYFYTEYNQQNFHESFRIMLIILSIRFIYQVKAFGENSTPRLWTKHLHEAMNYKELRVRDIRFLVTKDLVTKIIIDNNLGQYMTHKVYEKSFSNVLVYIKTITGEYTLKFFSPNKTRKDFKNEIEIINKLKSKGVPVYKLRKLNTKFAKFNCYGYNRMYYIAKHIKGTELDRHSFKLKHVKLMGQMLRRIHDVGITHGDFSKRNLLFDNNQITGVLDFEYSICHANPKALMRAITSDLAHAIVLLLISYSASYISYDKRVAEFLLAYQFFAKTQGLRKALIYHSKNELAKYKKLNPQGDFSKYNEVVDFVGMFKGSL